MKTSSITAFALTFSMLLSSPIHAADFSQDLSAGAVSMVASPLVSVEGNPIQGSAFFVMGASFVVVGIGKAVGNTISVIVQNTVDGSKAVVQLSSSVVQQTGFSVGNSIKVIAESTGHVLIGAGKILAFVPNSLGVELLHQSKLSK